MTYSTMMVNLEMGYANEDVLGIARELADRFRSRVVGISSAEPIVAFDGVSTAGDQIEEDVARIKVDMAGLEQRFRSAFPGRDDGIEWRSRIMYGSHSAYVAREARCADLVITAASGASRSLVEPGPLVIEAGRPLLVVPRGAAALDLGQAVVCWTDTREARRAVRDGLPLLRLAARVEVVEVASESDLIASRARLDDVVGWLKSHGVPAVGFAHRATGDARTLLEGIFRERNAGFVVAGAYGHARVGEWAFGGVTRSLLVDARRVSLLSH